MNIENSIGYDTLKLHLANVDIRTVLRSKALIGNEITTREATGATRYRKHLDNLTVRIHTNAITIEGSFATYKYGNNLKLVDGQEVLEIVDELSDLLHLSLRWATIRRLDFATSLLISKDTAAYANIVFPTVRYRIDRSQDNSFYVQSESNTITVYDKRIELREKKRIDIDTPVTRLEMRLEKEVGQHVEGCDASSLFVEDLARSEISRSVASTFQSTIQKQFLEPAPSPDLMKVSGKKSFFEYLKAEYFQYPENRESFARMIDTKAACGEIAGATASELRKELRKSYNSDEHDLINELQSAISDVVDQFISQTRNYHL